VKVGLTGGPAAGPPQFEGGNMLESSFRTNVIKWIKAKDPAAFVWVNEAKFKAGFPDLTIIRSRLISFAELKVCDDQYIVPARFMALFRPRQIFTIKEMIKAGAQVRGLVYYQHLKEVVTVEFKDGVWGWSPVKIFKKNFVSIPKGKY
jgi:hypothetical protein